MLRPATPADRSGLIAVALAEDAAWSDESEVSAEEVGDFIDRYRPGAATAKDGDLVIPAEDGEPCTRTDYANWRRRVFKNHAASGRPYDLRHGYASLLVREGCDLATIARRMGNSPQMVAQHYTHVFEEYEGRPRLPMEAVVVSARRGHSEDTLSTVEQGSQGTPKARQTPRRSRIAAPA